MLPMSDENGIKVRISRVGDEFWINAREMIEYLREISLASENRAEEVGPSDPLRRVGYFAIAEKFGTLAQAMDLSLIEAASDIHAKEGGDG
jgi:hypothetical protein